MSQAMEALPTEADGSSAVAEIRAAIASGDAPRVVVRCPIISFLALQRLPSPSIARGPREGAEF